jgi:UDP-N-acetylmuramoyl-L-alanyl-D-glutamate--2,6-diaminopimelate ligase
MNMPAEHLTAVQTLAELLQGYADAPALPVRGIASDSRRVREGYVFFACQGINSHGLDYLAEATAAGASAVVYDASTAATEAKGGLPMIGVAHLRDRLGEIANRFYGRPSEALRVIGVTGTNGKTTVAWLVAQCERLLGERCAYLGTLGFGIDEISREQSMTTPAAIELHERLAGFVEYGADIAAIEVSSHALSQGRVDGVCFEAALFTNLTRDHLDYHASMREYFEAKARLFLETDTKERIINVDSKFGAELAARCGQDTVIVSTSRDGIANDGPFLFAHPVALDERGSNVRFNSSWGEGHFSITLPGDFNIANAALVLALMLQQGVSKDAACDALFKATAPPGRMQRVAGQGPTVYVDYAHTPNAIEAALRALRPHCRGRLWCVFGCGGQRDTGKRPLMGKSAERFADHVVVTSDNPRSENPLQIIDAIVAGMARPDSATVVEDRAAAIAWTVSAAAETDVILIAGRGHEACQQIGMEKRPFSDYLVAEAALAAAARGGAQ